MAIEKLTKNELIVELLEQQKTFYLENALEQDREEYEKDFTNLIFLVKNSLELFEKTHKLINGIAEKDSKYTLAPPAPSVVQKNKGDSR